MTEASPPTPDLPTPNLHRHPDWQSRLTRYLALAAATPFQPGELDCALFAAGAVEAQTGTDLAAIWRGYTSLEEGFQRLSAAGFDDHVALVASLLDEVPLADALPGDIAALNLGRNLPSLGVVQGEFVYVLVEDGLIATRRGLQLVPLALANRAFRVPAPASVPA